jgi:hypothetical protein
MEQGRALLIPDDRRREEKSAEEEVHGLANALWFLSP